MILSGLAWFVLVAASIGGEVVFPGIQLGTLEIILFQMQFGHLWLFRFGCCLVLGVLLLIKRCESISAGLAILVLASLGGAGHAGANASSRGLLALAVDVCHLVFAALWPGGLVPLFLLMTGFGAWNLLVLKPRLLHLAEVDPQRGSPEFVASLYRNVACETVLAAGVLLIIGLLGVTPPPMR